MSTNDLKAEILRALDNVPEDLLGDVLAYVQEVQKSETAASRRALHLKKILEEDKDLLKKLAQ